MQSENQVILSINSHFEAVLLENICKLADVTIRSQLYRTTIPVLNFIA